MGATRPVFLKHTFIGKSKQDKPYTARAHSRYIQRQSETHRVYTHLLPENYNARQRWFFEHENGLRKNGRVIDKFTISIPHEISEEHAVATLAAFGKWLGQERAPFMFSLQGFESRNHHAHFVFIDRDVETGERVYGTTERNSTQGIKLEWERVANSMFAELGYDVQIKVKDSHEMEADNDNGEEPAHGTAVATPNTTERTKPVLEDVREDEEFMVDEGTIERAPDRAISLAGNDIRLLAATVAEQNRLHDSQQRLKDATDLYMSLSDQRERAALDASAYSVQTLPIYQAAETARQQMAQHQKPNGKLKGMQFRLLGWELKTSSRKEAERAQAEMGRRTAAAEHAVRKQAAYYHSLAVVSAQASAAEREAFMRQNDLRATYGAEADIQQAERDHDTTILKVVQTVPLEHAEEAFLALEITPDEYQTYLEQSGQEEKLAEFLENKDRYQVVDVDDEGYEP